MRRRVLLRPTPLYARLLRRGRPCRGEGLWHRLLRRRAAGVRRWLAGARRRGSVRRMLRWRRAEERRGVRRCLPVLVEVLAWRGGDGWLGHLLVRVGDV